MISITLNRNQYDGNDSTTVFPYTFEIAADAELLVYLTDGVSDPEVTTLLTLTTDYTVSDAGEAAGGNVTYTGGGTPLPTGWRLTILRDTVEKQLTDFDNQGGYFAESTEDAVDKLTRIVQDHTEQFDRAVLAEPETEDPTPGETLKTSLYAAEAAAVASATAAASSASAASSSASSAAADAVLTAADVVSTNADAVSTAADRVQTGLDAVATAADVVTIAGAEAATAADAVATAADRVQTGLDATATAADRVQTGLDEVATDADATATAADRVQTGIDAAAAAASAAAAAATVAATANFASTVETAIDVNPADPYKMYLVNASAGHRTITLPNASASAGEWYAITLVVDGNHVEITTVGGSQTFGETGLTSIGVFTEGATLILSTNAAGDGYDVVMDTREYYRVVDVTANLDLSSGGYESGSVYLCAPAVGVGITVTLPTSAATHRGTSAKFLLMEGAGGYGTATISEPVSGFDEEIATPGKGFEAMDDGTEYHIIQDSRPSASAVALFQFATTTASDVGGYLKTVASQSDADYDEPAVDASLGTVTGPDVLLVSFSSDAGDLVGTTEQTTVTSSGKIRKTVAGNADANVYVTTSHRNLAGTETLLGTSNLTADIELSTYVQFDVKALIPQQSWIATDRIVTKVYANKIGGATSPTLEMEVGGSTPAYTTFAIPVSAVAHNSTSNIENAGDSGVTHGHLTSDQFEQIVAPNLLINADGTDPESQRDSSKTYTSVADGAYIFDRWYVNHNCTRVDADVQADGGIRLTVVTKGAGTYCQLHQKVEYTHGVVGKILVASTEARSNLAMNVLVYDGSSNFITSNSHSGGETFEPLQGVGTFADNGQLNWYYDCTVLADDDYIEMKTAKLEVGSVATPFVADLPGVNLAKCRYYYRTVGHRQMGLWVNSTTMRICGALDSPMRIAPQPSLATTSMTGEIIGSAGVNSTGSTIAASVLKDDSWDITIDGWASGGSYGAWAFITNVDPIILNAEL